MTWIRYTLVLAAKTSLIVGAMCAALTLPLL